MRSAFDDARTPRAASGISFSTDVLGLLSLTLQDVQAIVDLRCGDAARASTLSDKDDAIQLVTVLEYSWTAKDA